MTATFRFKICIFQWLCLQDGKVIRPIPSLLARPAITVMTSKRRALSARLVKSAPIERMSRIDVMKDSNQQQLVSSLVYPVKKVSSSKLTTQHGRIQPKTNVRPFPRDQGRFIRFLTKKSAHMEHFQPLSQLMMERKLIANRAHQDSLAMEQEA